MTNYFMSKKLIGSFYPSLMCKKLAYFDELHVQKCRTVPKKRPLVMHQNVTYFGEYIILTKLRL